MTLERLWEQPGLPESALPEALAELYGGGLGFDTPAVVTNFVETVDGVVAIPAVERSNALVAGGSAADRFVMGLLRAFADVVVVGAGTLLASPAGRWRPEGVYPDARDAFAELRASLGKPERAPVAVVSSGASLDVSHPVLAEGGVLLTTERGAAAVGAAIPDVVAVNDGDVVDVRAALDVLRARGHELVLSEAGPTMFGSLLAEGLVDELFLTVSPRLAGRGASVRLGLVEGVELLPDVQTKLRLLSIRRAEDHLFLRYACGVRPGGLPS